MSDGEKLYGLLHVSGDEIFYMSKRELRALRDWLGTQTLPEWKSGQPEEVPPGAVATIFGRPVCLTPEDMWL